MSWFPYPRRFKLDKFYAILYDDLEWSGKVPQSNNRAFYDRSWQVEVVGPISSSIGNGEWARCDFEFLAPKSECKAKSLSMG